MKWTLVFTKQAQRDAKTLAAAGLKPKAEELLKVLEIWSKSSATKDTKSQSIIKG